MSKDESTPRIYGAPDTERQLPPAAEAIRGEGAPTLEEPKAEQTRSIVAEGRPIEVAETSGIAFAESTTAKTDDDHE